MSIRTFKCASHYGRAISLSPQELAFSICPHLMHEISNISENTLISSFWLWKIKLFTNRLNFLEAYRLNGSSISLHFPHLAAMSSKNATTAFVVYSMGAMGGIMQGLKDHSYTIMTDEASRKWKLFIFIIRCPWRFMYMQTINNGKPSQHTNVWEHIYNPQTVHCTCLDGF